ncbi:hypothetical protein [Capnocytophaga felis]|uniref:Uncharacterized protein n=1 Tax=Capnocytophaga felis TaxID=2267611 RepID=A0A5M4BA02_9FLAO|nr:hypothetical protein [Capnocytophaga felis]GET45936.1 hypothetical protein RCZ01_12380 [Capnocytophaga felis]GET49212.1 hypothetical protein RCZ02_20430 [Capnocytophaga felis]
MKHSQILDKLVAKHLVEAMDDDLARLVWWEIAASSNETPQKQLESLMPKFLLRWDCALKPSAEKDKKHYRNKTLVAMATLLHKYGFSDPKITAQAFDAIDSLNKDVVLSDDFARKTPQIKELLKNPPAPLKRRPALPESVTFYRPKDIIAIELENIFYIAYIHTDTGINQSPVVEFYEKTFDKVPTLDELKNTRTIGEEYSDGTTKISKFSISGLKYLPDPAGQVTLIASAIDTPPDNKHLKHSIGLYTMSSIFEIQLIIKRMFSKGGDK